MRFCRLLGLTLVTFSGATGATVPPPPNNRPPRSQLVVSVDVGTESTRAAVFDASGALLGLAAVKHATDYPRPGWAEQDPAAWWSGLGEAVRGAVAESGCDPASIGCLCLATTSCTVLALDDAGVPLRPALLWMDARSAVQAAEIMARGAGDPALSVNCGGAGPLSAEWMLPKALWLKENEPTVWAAAATVCECQDWLNFKLTGELVAGGCNVATRWHCDGVEALRPAEDGGEGGFGGQPTSLLARVGLSDLGAKWPRRCVAMGAPIGPLTSAACARLGLAPGVLLVQGGADAFVAMVGMGAVGGGVLGLVTGSSHLQVRVAKFRIRPGL